MTENAAKSVERKASDHLLKQKLEKQKEVDLKVKKERAQLEKIFNETFNTASGKLALRYLMNTLGADRTSLALNQVNGSYDMERIVFNEARRSVWLMMSALLDDKLINEVHNDRDKSIYTD